MTQKQHNNHRCYKDGDNWEPLDPMVHLYKGRPYHKPLHDMVDWDIGIGLPNRNYDKQPKELRDIQDLNMLDTFIIYISKVACEILQGMEEICSAREIRPYARKHLYSIGLPDIKTKNWDYELASRIIDLWRDGGISRDPSAG